jgi:Fe-S-cluster containining protein
MEPVVLTAVTGEHVACRRGCASCCSLLLMVTMPEALALYQAAANDPKLLIQVHRSVAQYAPPVERGELPQSTWFARNITCAFLSDDKLCQVYAQRPVGCRLHVAFRTAEFCQPGASAKPLLLNTMTLAGETAKLLSVIADTCGLPVGVIPLAVALRWARIVTEKGTEALRQKLERSGVPAYDLGAHTCYWAERCQPS